LRYASPARRILLAACLLLLVSGCQSLALGVANHGAGRADASVVFDPQRGLQLDIYRPRNDDAAARPVVVFFYGAAGCPAAGTSTASSAGGWRTWACWP
jgi:hypothetical protein